MLALSISASGESCSEMKSINLFETHVNAKKKKESRSFTRKILRNIKFDFDFQYPTQPCLYKLILHKLHK